MDINQIMELWRSLSPHLAGAIPAEELPEGEHNDEDKSDRNSEDKAVASIESRHEEEDV